MPFTPPIISALTAAILIVMQIALMTGVILARRRNWQSLGDRGHKDLLISIRRHGNFAENAALFIAGFTLLEILGDNRVVLEILCAAFALARISHAIGLSTGNTVNPFRFTGIGATITVGLVLAERLVRVAISQLLV
ncbi:MAG TPA: MAPEG family protein [Steroidobacteraceae bacterium]